VVLVVMAGRALAMEAVVPQVHALLYAWHPGCMGGPALADLLFGRVAQRQAAGDAAAGDGADAHLLRAQAHGQAATPESIVRMDDIPARATQLSVGNTSFHLDVHPSPLFPFGFGLTYTSIRYEHPDAERLECMQRRRHDSRVTSSTPARARRTEVVQLYVVTRWPA
jgi:beta-glucosidase